MRRSRGPRPTRPSRSALQPLAAVRLAVSLLTAAAITQTAVRAGQAAPAGPAPPAVAGDPTSPAASAPAGPGLRFREVSSAWGLDFRHHDGGSGAYYMVETMGGGVVLFDYDGDGDPDVFFVDGGKLPGFVARGASEEPRSRLFRNDGGGRFADVTERSRLRVAGYGMGGTAGDYDGDGDLDLYVTQFGPDQLFRNDGDGGFTDVTARSGTGDPLWSASAAFADVDRDGDLDLFVANYVDFGFDNHKFCGDKARGRRDYCIPDVYNGLPVRLYRNRGDGTFEDATRQAGLGEAVGAGLGVVFGDVDDDGWPDLYVANDRTPNFLFRNRGDGTFEDVSLASGTAYGPAGIPEGGMGTDMGDADGDGRQDILVTNFALETNGLYRNLGGGSFFDARFVSGLAEPSLLFVAFGVAMADLDLDGDLDVAVANGHVLERPDLAQGASPRAQRNQLFENLGGGKFREVMDGGLDVVRVSRGLAAGDLDGDGDLDLVIGDIDERAQVYENLSPRGGWLAVDLRGEKSEGFGVGARVELETGAGAGAAGRKQVREVRTASSYLSQNELTLRFGLGGAERAGRLTVRWPRGPVQVYEGLGAGWRVLVPE